MTGRREPPHSPFPLTGGLMGVFGAIIEIAVLPMLHTGEDLPFGGAIARQFIRDHHPGDIRQTFEELPEELLGSALVAASLYEDIKHVAVLIDGAPQILPLAMNRQKHLI